MKAPNKFWFYHCVDKNNICFAEGDEHGYAISGGELERPMYRTPHDVEYFLREGLWVLTVPNKFKVRGVITDTIYDLCKDANNLYVMTYKKTTSPIFHSEEQVLDSLYGKNPLWEVYTEEGVEERVKDLSAPDNFKFRHWSDCEHNGNIFSATRCKDGYRVEWDTRESHERMYSNSEVGSYLSRGNWIMVEADTAKENPSDKKLISINVNSVRAAAEFDVANNKRTIKKNLSVEEIEEEIVEHIREMYSALISGEREWEMCYVCSRSYSVRFRPEDENYGVISVEVDPSIGKPIFYAPVEDFLNQN